MWLSWVALPLQGSSQMSAGELHLKGHSVVLAGSALRAAGPGASAPHDHQPEALLVVSAQLTA